METKGKQNAETNQQVQTIVKQSKIKRKTILITASVVLFANMFCSAWAVYDTNEVLDSMESFLIQQMEVFDSVSPPNQPPLVQTFGWDPNLPFPPNDLNPSPCTNPPCAPDPLPEMKYRGDTYDHSTIVCWFVECARLDFINGRDPTQNLGWAKKLLDAIIFLRENDPCGDGRIRAAYWANNLLNPSGTEASIMDPDTGIGNMGWFGIALTRFCYVAEITSYLDSSQRQQYLQVARETADWIVEHCEDPNWPFGFRGGYGGWNQISYTWKSTEHNIDVYVLAQNLYRLDGNPNWAEMAKHAQEFVKEMFDPFEGYYYTGTKEDGITPNPSPVPADAQSWSALAEIDDPNRRALALEFLARSGLDPNSANDLLILESCDDCCDILGIKFSDIGTHIQCEATAGAAMAFLLEYKQQEGQDLVESLDRIRICAAPPYDGIADGNGIVATPCLEGAWTGYGQYAWYYKLLHVASSAWTGLAVMVLQGDEMANPLKPLPITGDFNQDDKVDFVDFALLAKNYPKNSCEIPYWCGGFDLNHDDLIDLADLAVFCWHWLEPYN